MKLKGKDIVLRLAGKTVACSTSCTMDITVSTIDASTKDDEGVEEVVSIIKYNLSSESFIDACGDAQHSFAALVEAILKKQPVDFEMFVAANAAVGIPGGNAQPSVQQIHGYKMICGKALITSLSHKAPVKGFAVCALQLSGQGVLNTKTIPTQFEVSEGTLVATGEADVVKGELYVFNKNVNVDKNILNYGDTQD